jgi:putative redox protein
METIRTEYQGEYRTEATHILSQQKLITDAPLDNNGKGQAFSPTDLVATALTSCMLTLMDMTANTHGFSLGYVSAKTTKVMASAPRRISQIIIVFDLSAAVYTERQKKILKTAADNCPVFKSIHPDIEVQATYIY